MKIGIGSDHNAFEMKEALKEHLKALGIEIIDYGCFSADEVDYPNIAFQVSEGVLSKEVERGILCCGTGKRMNEQFFIKNKPEITRHSKTEQKAAA